MAQITIPKYNQATGAGTLSGIASQYKTDIPTLQKLNPQITDINKIQAGASLNVPDIPQAPIIPPTSGAITFNTQNPALQNLINETNRVVDEMKAGGATLSPEITENINKINTFESQKMSDIAKAREAADKKEAGLLDTSIKGVGDMETAQKSALDTLRENLKTQQETYLTALKPTEAETELKRKLNTLRTERQLLPLELRREGISAAGIAGRQVEDERVRAIQESNLLMEIGLEQEARQFKTLSAEKQLGFIRDDITLQNKIDEQLKKEERQIVEDARNLRKDSLSAMSDILKSFKGLAWEDLDAESQAELVDTAKQFSIPVNMLAKAMKNAKQQRVFDNALKMAQEEEPTKSTIIEDVVSGKADISQIADLVGGFSSVNAQKIFLGAINKLAQQGNTKAIAEKIVGQSLDNIAEPEIRKRVSGGFKIAKHLTRLGGLLDEYESEGGETGLISGNIQKAYQKVGQLGDPKLANIGTQILNTLDLLARSRTGAVITESEEKLYGRILPSIDKVGELNTEIINGLRDSLMFDVEDQLRFNITEDGLDMVKKELPDIFEFEQKFEVISDEEAKKTFQEVIQSKSEETKEIPKFEYKSGELFQPFWQSMNKFFGK